MIASNPVPEAPRPRRRAALAGALALAAGGSTVLAACTGGSAPPAPTGSRTPGADEVALRAAALTERDLATLATSVAATPGLTPTLLARARAAVTAHTAHAAALVEGLPTASPSAVRSPSPGTVSPRGLAAAQTAAATALQAALLPVSGPSARLLGSVAASDAALAAQLRAAGA